MNIQSFPRLGTKLFRVFSCRVAVLLLFVMPFPLSVFDSPVSSTAASLSSSLIPSSPKPPIPLIINMSSLSSSVSSFSVAGTDSGGRGVAGHVEGNGLPPEPGSTVEQRVLSVWDFEHVQKNGLPNDKKTQTWTCAWCRQTFKHWNATKALFHLTKIAGKDVRICKAAHDNVHKELYKSFLKEKDKSLASLVARNSNMEAMVNDGQQSLAVMFEAGRHRVSCGGGSSGGGTSIATAHSRVSNDNTVEASTASQLTMSIADFVHSSGLSFSATQGQHFLNILKYARGVPSTYKPPTRNSIATSLLKINYARRIERQVSKLF